MDKLFEIEEKIIKGDTSDFEGLALQVFEAQYLGNPLYRAYCEHLKKGPDNVSSLQDIPYLPIEFFKSHKVLTGDASEQNTVFESSSTGGVPSKHYVRNPGLYEKNARNYFEQLFGPLVDMHVFALLPNYLERGSSSLVHMVNHFIEKAGGGGFYLYENEKLIEDMQNTPGKKVLFGVSFALLDLAEMQAALPEDIVIIETGGMKGKRKEIIKSELHARIKEGTGVKDIYSEYGMTELLSQAYALDGIWQQPAPSMHVSVREPEDPFAIASEGRGGLNIIDLANLWSCAFIETKDLAEIRGDAFQILGRFEASDVRGCNLMYT